MENLVQEFSGLDLAQGQRQSMEEMMDIKLGSRVVWFNADEPEVGTCKYLGKLNNEFLAGIEFVNPIGNSNGIYTDAVTYFHCEENHGKFILLEHLMLYEDFYGEDKPVALESCVKLELETKEMIGSGSETSIDCQNYTFRRIICIICKDSILMQASNEKPAIATRCGHLFHKACIEDRFKDVSDEEKLCPGCSKKVNMAVVIRVFPVQLYDE